VKGSRIQQLDSIYQQVLGIHLRLAGVLSKLDWVRIEWITLEKCPRNGEDSKTGIDGNIEITIRHIRDRIPVEAKF